MVAGAAGGVGKPGSGPREGVGEGSVGGAHGGDGQVDAGLAVGAVPAGADEGVGPDGAVAVGQLGPGAGAAPAADVAALAQQVVGAGDGGPAGADGLGELAFGGQAHVQGDAAVEDQRADGLGERPVAGAGEYLGGEQRRELAAADGSVRCLDHSPVRHANLP